MIQFGRIFDRGTAADRHKLTQVQALFRRIFPREAEYADTIARLLAEHAHPDCEAILLTAENEAGTVIGFVQFFYFPNTRFGYLNYIGSDPERPRRGIGQALYEIMREYLANRGARGLLLEFPPDEAGMVSDSKRLSANRSRARFYESFDVRPILNTAWNEPPEHPGYDPPWLAYDSLGSDRPLHREVLRRVMAAILEHRYQRSPDEDYVKQMIGSVRDNPVRLRSPRYQRRQAPTPIWSGRLTPIKLLIPRHHEIHHVRQRGYVERPARVSAIVNAMRNLPVETRPARHVGEKAIRAVHASDYVNYLRRATGSLGEKETIYPEVFPIRRPNNRPREMAIRAGYYCIDTFTPLSRAAYRSARAAVDCAVEGASLLLAGEQIVYALCRPPGHHAEYRAYGGFCYFNNAAIAAQILSQSGTVAILDIDYHAGNGQQVIFYDRNDVLTLSLHGRPRDHYPYFSGYADEHGEGAGKGYNRNFPLPDLVGDDAYLKALTTAIDLIRDFKPTWLIVALGYDTMRGDPTGNFDLSAHGMHRIGEAIGCIELPVLVTQEGGYSLKNLRSGARNFFSGLLTGWYL